MTPLSGNGYQNLGVFFGDLHNHCGLSYGRGSLEDALQNARLQLDFTSVTMHAAWPDIPTNDPKLDYLVDYHQKGFTKASNNWPAYLQAIEQYNQEGQFVTFPSYEWHSIKYGDYCVYFKCFGDWPILSTADLATLRKEIRQLNTPVFLIPHHIGYKQGSRGINWHAFTDEFSPVVEIFSFHGLSESSDGPYPYLHSMGPRHQLSTAQYGWSLGHTFGIIGSSDHHNAFPGSYGVGRLGVWAESLTRDAIWTAISNRRTYALTGDRIELAFSINGHIMGEKCPYNSERLIEVEVIGGDAIDYVDVLHNNYLIHRYNAIPNKINENFFKVFLEVGWGEETGFTPWSVDLQILNGRLLGVEPRFRGYGPTDQPEADVLAYTHWELLGENKVHFTTRTRKNQSIYSPATEGMSLEIETDENTCILAKINGRQYIQPVSELINGARTYNLGGFVSPAFCFHRAIPRSEYNLRFAFLHQNASYERDWYYIRVRQRNNQWAWSSPIWVDKRSE